MTPLSNADVRRLDALNLIEALGKHDQEAVHQIQSLYARASVKDYGQSCFELAFCAANWAAKLLNLADSDGEFLTKCRDGVLNGETP